MKKLNQISSDCKDIQEKFSCGGYDALQLCRPVSANREFKSMPFPRDFHISWVDQLPSHTTISFDGVVYFLWKNAFRYEKEFKKTRERVKYTIVSFNQLFWCFLHGVFSQFIQVSKHQLSLQDHRP